MTHNFKRSNYKYCICHIRFGAKSMDNKYKIRLGVVLIGAGVSMIIAILNSFTIDLLIGEPSLLYFILFLIALVIVAGVYLLLSGLYGERKELEIKERKEMGIKVKKIYQPFFDYFASEYTIELAIRMRKPSANRKPMKLQRLIDDARETLEDLEFKEDGYELINKIKKIHKSNTKLPIDPLLEDGINKNTESIRKEIEDKIKEYKRIEDT